MSLLKEFQRKSKEWALRKEGLMMQDARHSTFPRKKESRVEEREQEQGGAIEQWITVVATSLFCFGFVRIDLSIYILGTFMKGMCASFGDDQEAVFEICDFFEGFVHSYRCRHRSCNCSSSHWWPILLYIMFHANECVCVCVCGLKTTQCVLMASMAALLLDRHRCDICTTQKTWLKIIQSSSETAAQLSK